MSARSFVRLATPNAMKSPTAPRSILKRPAPLALSPTTSIHFAANFSISVSPSPTPKSVRFPTSPGKLTATFATFSPSAYDRSALFSPSHGSSNGKAIEQVFAEPTPRFSARLDPPPIPSAVPANIAGPKPSRASLRFKQTLAVNSPQPLPREELGSALLKFPRSPYPTAPMSPAGKENVGETRARVNSTSGATPRRPGAPLKTIGTESNAVGAGGLTAEERLSEDFWKSVKLDTSEAPSTPTLMFGTSEGALWSPAPPKAQPVQPLGLSSMVSPGARTTFVTPDAILSPMPHTPFPSFTAVISNGTAEFVSVPPKAVLGF